MPKGFAEIYSKQTKVEAFIDIENILSTASFYLEHPNTNYVRVWNEEGNMLELSRGELLPHFKKGNFLITFWNDSGDSVSISFDEDVHKICKIILFLDGFDSRETESLFNLIKTFALSKYGNKLTGFVFDRREISENISWGECIHARKPIMYAIENRLKPISHRAIKQGSSMGFDVNNAYLAIKRIDGELDIYEFGLMTR